MVKNFLFNNIGLKLLALFLAVAAWEGIRQDTSFEESVYDVPLTIQHSPEWAVLERSVNGFDIQFRGSKEDILKLNNTAVRVEVNVEGRALDKVLTLELKEKNVIYPGQARVIDIKPRFVRITLDKMEKKKVPVKANLIGELEKGYTVDSAECSPASVFVMGSQKRLEGLDLVETEAIDISGRIQSFESQAALVPPAVNLVDRIEPARVLVSIMVKLATTEKAFDGVPVSILMRDRLPAGLVLEPQQVNVLVKGKPEMLEKLDPDSLDVYVNCTRLETGTQYELPVRVDLPANMQVVDVEPAVITVRVTGKK